MISISQVFGLGPNISGVSSDFMPFDYDLKYTPSAPGNTRGNLPVDDYGLPLTEEEIMKIMNSIPKTDMATFKMLTDKAIKDQPKWLPGTDTKPKKDLNASSSAVSEVKILPGTNNIAIRFNNKGKTYTYDGGGSIENAAKAVMELLNSPSIGRALNRYDGGSWGSVHSLKK